MREPRSMDMAKKLQQPRDIPNINAYSDEERRALIHEREEARLAVVREIEALVTQYAKESGDRSLRRREKVGRAANDYEGETY